MKSRFKISGVKHSAIIMVSFLLLARNTAILAASEEQGAKAAVKESAYQQPAFYAMCILAIVLLIYIRQLSKLFTSVVSDYAKKQKSDSNAGTTLMVLAMVG